MPSNDSVLPPAQGHGPPTVASGVVTEACVALRLSDADAERLGLVTKSARDDEAERYVSRTLGAKTDYAGRLRSEMRARCLSCAGAELQVSSDGRTLYHRAGEAQRARWACAFTTAELADMGRAFGSPDTVHWLESQVGMLDRRLERLRAKATQLNGTRAKDGGPTSSSDGEDVLTVERELRFTEKARAMLQARLKEASELGASGIVPEEACRPVACQESRGQ